MRKGKGRINCDDDVVCIYEGKKIIYKGIEDESPMRDDPWVWDESIRGYRFGKYIEILIG